MASRNYDSARKKAAALRSALQLQEPWLPVVDAIEFMLPQVFDGFEYEVVGLDELPGQYALAYPRQRRLIIREDVYNGACDNNPRDRFTLAHELGHLFLHQGIQARIDEKSMKDMMNNCEVEANVFGMELLMPSPIALETGTPALLAHLCGASRSIAIRQWIAARSSS